MEVAANSSQQPVLFASDMVFFEVTESVFSTDSRA